MKLYVTPGSPYARLARIVVLEKQLDSRVEILPMQLRVAGSPYYQINPSGRVPYLVRDDGVGMEESSVVCAYLDQLDGAPAFDWPPGDAGWEGRRLEALARSMLDGLAVWGRELRRPENERSPGIIAHEAARNARLLDQWEAEIANPLMRGPLNLAQMTLVAAFGFGARIRGYAWRPGHPRLSEWFDAISARPSIAATAPPDH